MSGKPKTPGTLRGLRRRKSGVARPTLTTPILKQVDDSTWARVDAVELEEEDPEEVNAHKLPVFSSRALPPSPRTAPPSERPSSMNDATNTKWWTIRQPSPFVSARKTPTPSPAPSRERDENEIPTSGTAVDDLASPRVNSRVRRPARSARNRCDTPLRSLVTADILCLEPALGASPRPCASRGLKRRRVSERVVDQETASVDSPAIRAVSPGAGILSLLRKGAAIDTAADERKRRLPPGFSVREATSFDDAALQTLSTAFAAEDPRVGKLPRGGPTGGVRGRAHVLDDAEGEAIGYTLTFENVAPPWDMERSLELPPRLAHIFILRGWRRRGIGTAFFLWWRDLFGATVRLFAVDTPSEAMNRVLVKGMCVQTATRSGHNASAVHFHSRAMERT